MLESRYYRNRERNQSKNNQSEQDAIEVDNHIRWMVKVNN